MLCVRVKAWSGTVTPSDYLHSSFWPLSVALSHTPSDFHPPPPRPPSVLSGVMATDPSSAAYPGIPEQLFGSLASAVLRPADERGNGKTSLSFPPPSKTATKLLFPPALCSFVFLIASTPSAFLTLERQL